MWKLDDEKFAEIQRRIRDSSRKVNGKYGLNGAENAPGEPPARPKAQPKAETADRRQERATGSPDEPLTILLPWPPTVNHYWRLKHNGGRFISAAGRKFRAEVNMAAHGMPHAAGKVQIAILASPPDKRRRDLDNILKSLFDALQHAHLIGDDFNIEAFSVRRMPVVKGGRVSVTISPFREV